MEFEKEINSHFTTHIKTFIDPYSFEPKGLNTVP